MKILITAGPTREAIDPVRYISNHSSGKMGYALAEAARDLGHEVILVSGPTALARPGGVQFVPVITAREMRQAVFQHFKKANIIIKVAAVADYRPMAVARQKIKKTKNTLTLKLIKNPDILKELGKKKGEHQILVGFAAETKNPLGYAKVKLKEKNCDWIVVNNVAQKGIGFGADDNAVVLLGRHGHEQLFQKQSKSQLARSLLEIITSHL